MTRNEAIAILAQQAPEVREAAAVYCQTDTGKIDAHWLDLECARKTLIERGEIEERSCMWPGCTRTGEHEHLCGNK